MKPRTPLADSRGLAVKLRWKCLRSVGIQLRELFRRHFEGVRCLGGRSDHQPERVLVGVVEDLANHRRRDKHRVELFERQRVRLSEPYASATLEQDVELLLLEMAVFRGCLPGTEAPH